MVPSMVNDLYIIRFAVCAKHATDEDMKIAYQIIQEHATIIIAEYKAQRNGRHSSSNDSLETVHKPVTTTNIHQESVIPDEQLDQDIHAETMNNQMNSSTTKARVKSFLSNRTKANSFFFYFSI